MAIERRPSSRPVAIADGDSPTTIESDTFDGLKPSPPRPEQYGRLLDRLRAQEAELAALRTALARQTALRCRAEQAQRLADDRYRRAIEDGPLGVATLDRDYLIQDVNRAYCAMVGYAAEELRGQPLGFVTHPDDLPTRLELNRMTFAGEIPRFATENRYIRKDGAVVWGRVRGAVVRDDDGEVLYGIVFVEDITGEKLVRETLRQNEELVRRAMQGSAVGLFDWNILTDEVNFLPPWEETLGYAPGQLAPLAKAWIEHFHPDDVSVVAAALEDHFQGRADTYEAIHRLRTRDGRWRWIHARGQLIARDAAGRPQRLVGIHMDVTDREEAMAEVRKNHRLLRELLELHERDRQLVAYEIHDGLAQYLAAAALHFQAVRPAIVADPTIAGNFDKAASILQDGLNEVRRLIGGLKPTVLEQHGILAAVEDLVWQAQSRDGLEVNLAVEGRFDRLSSPLERNIFRVVQESLSNVRRHSGSRRARVELIQTAPAFTIRVRDEGVGFDLSQVDGRRFGLRGIHERARLFGGEARISSAPGQGTEVFVSIPLGPPSGGD